MELGDKRAALLRSHRCKPFHLYHVRSSTPDTISQHIVCRQVSDTFPGANGINLWEDKLFVGDSKNGTVTIFQIHKDRTLTQLQTVVSER